MLPFATEKLLFAPETKLLIAEIEFFLGRCQCLLPRLIWFTRRLNCFAGNCLRSTRRRNCVISRRNCLIRRLTLHFAGMQLFDKKMLLWQKSTQLLVKQWVLLVKHRGLLLEKRLSLIAFLSAIYKIRVAKRYHFAVSKPSGFLPASRANDFLYREVVLPEKLLVLDRLVHGNLFRLEL